MRYLIKHAEFKEEQECRIIQIRKLDEEDVETDENKGFYIDYSELTPEKVQTMTLSRILCK